MIQYWYMGALTGQFGRKSVRIKKGGIDRRLKSCRVMCVRNGRINFQIGDRTSRSRYMKNQVLYMKCT